MSETAAERILAGLKEAKAIAEGSTPAASVTIAGHRYVSTTWQPIASAPKDGTDVLLYRGSTPPIVAGWFHNGEEGGWSSYDQPNQWVDFFEPSHWMPLPPPPTPTDTIEDLKRRRA